MNEEYIKRINENKGLPMDGNGVYVDSKLKFLLNKIDFDSINVILDLGARTAEQSVEFAYTFPKAKMYAFEAAPLCVKRCQKTLETYSQFNDRIFLFDKAVSDKSGKIDFFPLDETAGCSPNFGIGSMFKLIPEETKKFTGEKWVQTKVEVDAIRIDEWHKKNNIQPIDLVWMDIQGAELLALKGMGDLLHNVKAIMTEAGVTAYYEGHTLKPEIDQYLESFGFVQIPESICFGHTHECDVIYVNKKFMKTI